MFTLVKSEDLRVRDKRDGVFTGNKTQTLGESLSYLKTNELVGWFDSTSRFMEYLRTDMPQPKYSKSSSNVIDYGDFNAFGTYEEAMDTFVNHPSKVRGYDESDVVVHDGDNAGNSSFYDVTGDFLDVGRYMEGEPECFGIMTNGNPRSWRVNLIINIGWWCGIDHKTIVARSRRIQRLVDWLESQQIRTSMLAVSSQECSHVEIVVKDHDQVLDMNDVAIVSHPEFLRRLIFRFDEHSPTIVPGYGNAHSFGDCLSANGSPPDMYNEVNVFIDSRSTQNMSARFDSVENWLTKVLGDPTLEPSERYKTICH